jgi:nucleotide-binding universal stress UspA family protein
LHNLVPSEAELWCVPEYVIERGEVAETILNVAAQSKADLIVLAVRKPSGFPGAATHLPIAIAHKVVSRASCPVLTVRG